VAVLSPSWAAPAHFPEIHEQAMRRLRDVVGVEPVEYPTTRRDSAPQDLAGDLMAAFADTSIGAVLATIGGEDQITVLPYLEPGVIRRHPKPFLGYGDNTNLLNWLWRHGLTAFHGGSTQVHLGPGPEVASLHLRSLEAALFDGGDLEITPLTEFSEDGPDWGPAQALTDASPTRPAAPWACKAVLQELARYNPEAMAVFGVDLGHTSPQWVLPSGGRLTVDGPARRVIGHH